MGLFGSSKDKETIQRLTQQIYQQKEEYERKIFQLNNIVSKKEEEIKELKQNDQLETKDKEHRETEQNKSFILGAGKYKGGISIPLGIYDLMIVSGTGIIETEKPNKVFFRLESNKKVREERNWSDSYNGLVITNETIMDIGESAKVRFNLSRKIKIDDEEEEYIEKKKEIEERIKYLEMLADDLKSKIGDVIVLQKGVYYGGSTIPTGNYNLKILSGHTMIETSKPKVYFNLSKEYSGFETEYFGLEIKEGTKLQINSQAKIEFCLMDKFTDSGDLKLREDISDLDKQKEELILAKKKKENQIKSLKSEIETISSKIKFDTKNFILTAGKYKGGIDVPIGVYDIKVISGEGSFKTNKPEDIYENISSNKNQGFGFLSEYRNLEISENTILKIEGSANVEFSLSRKYDFSEETKEQKREIETEKRILEGELSTIKSEIQILNNELIKKYYNFSDYDNITSQDCKNKLVILKQKENDLRKHEKDVEIQYKYGITNKTEQRIIRQMLRTFNCECDNILHNISSKNIDVARRKIQNSFESINKLYLIDSAALKKELLELKLEQATLMYTYELKYQQEKDIQRAIKEQMMEEAKAQREIEEQKKKIEKDLQQHFGEINRIMKYMQKTTIDAEKQIYMDKIKELEEKIKSLESDKETVLEREANAKAGFVYIVSNIGSFGENIYKIGMTRRLEPMDRINELSSASVPFEFDVHAMIFSSDAPELENMLHKHFSKYAVNKVNPRKEFYNVDIDEIEKVVKENYNDTVQFTKIPIAAEYRQSLNFSENK